MKPKNFVQPLILVIGDLKFIDRFVFDMLQQSYKVFSSSTFETAKTLIATKKINLVVIQVYSKNAWYSCSFLQKIRRTKKQDDLPVLAYCTEAVDEKNFAESFFKLEGSAIYRETPGEYMNLLQSSLLIHELIA